MDRDECLSACGSGSSGSSFWELAGSTTLGTAGTSLAVSVASLKKFWKIEFNLPMDATSLLFMTFNASSATDYVRVTSTNGGATAVSNNQTSMILTGASRSGALTGIITGINVATEEKQITGQTNATDTGDTTASTQTEVGGKWVDVTNLITSIELVTTGNMSIGAEAVVSHHD